MKFLPTSFKNRLALLLGGLALLFGLPAAFYAHHVYTAQLVMDRSEALRNLATSAATVLSENLHERQREISLLAQSHLFRRAPLDSPDLMQTLERIQQSYPQYSWLGLADTPGTVRASTGKLLMGASVAQRPWFMEGLKGSYTGDLHEALLLSKLLPARADEVGPTRFIRFFGAGIRRAWHAPRRPGRACVLEVGRRGAQGRDAPGHAGAGNLHRQPAQ